MQENKGSWYTSVYLPYFGIVLLAKGMAGLLIFIYIFFFKDVSEEVKRGVFILPLLFSPICFLIGWIILKKNKEGVVRGKEWEMEWINLESNVKDRLQ